MRDRVGQQQLTAGDSLPVGSGLSSTVLAFTASLLTAPRTGRPATARAFTAALRAAIVAKK